MRTQTEIEEDMLEVIATTAVARHLNRNPRVESYSGQDIYTVIYDRRRAVPRHLAAEANQLGLTELARPPHV